MIKLFTIIICTLSLSAQSTYTFFSWGNNQQSDAIKDRPSNPLPNSLPKDIPEPKKNPEFEFPEIKANTIGNIQVYISDYNSGSLSDEQKHEMAECFFNVGIEKKYGGIITKDLKKRHSDYFTFKDKSLNPDKLNLLYKGWKEILTLNLNYYQVPGYGNFHDEIDSSGLGQSITDIQKIIGIAYETAMTIFNHENDQALLENFKTSLDKWEIYRDDNPDNYFTGEGHVILDAYTQLIFSFFSGPYKGILTYNKDTDKKFEFINEYTKEKALAEIKTKYDQIKFLVLPKILKNAKLDSAFDIAKKIIDFAHTQKVFLGHVESIIDGLEKINIGDEVLDKSWKEITKKDIETISKRLIFFDENEGEFQEQEKDAKKTLAYHALGLTKNNNEKSALRLIQRKLCMAFHPDKVERKLEAGKINQKEANSQKQMFSIASKMKRLFM
jgi:hypothetical protein